MEEARPNRVFGDQEQVFSPESKGKNPKTEGLEEKSGVGSYQGPQGLETPNKRWEEQNKWVK